MRVSIAFSALGITLAVLRPSALAFTLPNVFVPQTSNSARKAPISRNFPGAAHDHEVGAPSIEVISKQQVNPRNRITVVRNIEKAVSGAVLVTATSFLVSSGALAEYVDPDDVGDLGPSDLPPMWVPLAVGVVLAAGISLLQGSLGDVMNDEAKLGGLSGARAAKQSARDRDMFKKKK